MAKTRLEPLIFNDSNRAVFDCVKSNFVIALVLRGYILWLTKKSHTRWSTNHESSQNQSWITHILTYTLSLAWCQLHCTLYMYLLQVLISSLDCLPLLWLARVLTLMLFLRHSVENCSDVINTCRNWFFGFNKFCKIFIFSVQSLMLPFLVVQRRNLPKEQM